MFAKYGPMYSFSIFGRKQIMTKDADTAKRLLNGTAGGEIADAEFVRSPELQQMHKGLIHYGLFMIPSGAVWKRHRKVVCLSFSLRFPRMNALLALPPIVFTASFWSQPFALSSRCFSRNGKCTGRCLEGNDPKSRTGLHSSGRLRGIFGRNLGCHVCDTDPAERN